MGEQKLSDAAELVYLLKNGVWLSGIPAWIFGVVDRSIASISDGYVSPIDFFQVITAVVFFVSWLTLNQNQTLVKRVPTTSI